MMIIGIDPGISGSICFFQAEDGIRDVERSRGLGDVYKRQTQGSASHNFQQLGIIKIDKREISDEKILDLAIESGADECLSYEDYHEVQCQMSEIYNVKKNLEKIIVNFISTEIEWVPLNSVEVNKENKDNVVDFLETLEEDDDVQNVYSNVNLGGI